MTYRGHVQNGQIMLDGSARLPEGAVVQVELIQPSGNGEDLNAVLLRHAGKGRDLPADLAANHDHYVHGRPKL